MKKLYRGYTIQPKRDFPPGGYLSNGKVITKGWVVTDGGIVNVMPGATWFYTVKEAIEAIDVWEKVRHCAEKFWEIMQPFEFKVGDKLPQYKLPGGAAGTTTITHGRWTAYAENGVVVKVTKVPWSKYLKK